MKTWQPRKREEARDDVDEALMEDAEASFYEEDVEEEEGEEGADNPLWMDVVKALNQSSDEKIRRAILGAAAGDREAREALIVFVREHLVRLGGDPDEAKALFVRFYGLDAIDDLVLDDSVGEIFVNGAKNIWIERAGERTKTDRSFRDNEDLLRVIGNLLRFDRKSVSRDNPVVESRLADGSRVTIAIPDVAEEPTMMIRKFDNFLVTQEKLLDVGTLDASMADFIARAVRGRSNIVCYGATGSGKTSLLKYLISLLDPKLRIGSLETTFELHWRQAHPDRNGFAYAQDMKTGRTMDELFNLVLRSSPDAIIVGEVRSREALAMMHAFRRGHFGFSSFHTQSAETFMDDFRDVIVQYGNQANDEDLRYWIASSVDLLISMKKYDDHVRRVDRITEMIHDHAARTYRLQDLFVYDEDQRRFLQVGEPSASLSLKWKKAQA